AIMDQSEGWLDLGHFAEHRLSWLLFETNWNPAHVQFESHFAGARRTAQGECGAQRGMPGKRQFFLNCEDADPDSALELGRRVTRQDERGLGKIHLTRQSLHELGAYPARIVEYCQGISLERARGKNVKLHERKT